MELTDFTDEIGRIFDKPESVTRRNGMAFASRLHAFLQLRVDGTSQPSTASISRMWSDKTTVGSLDEELSPHERFWRQFERVLLAGLEGMRRGLLEALVGNRGKEVSAFSEKDDRLWQLLSEHFLAPMHRLEAFSRVMRVCLWPMCQWLDTGVLIGHRSLCLADQIRQHCLDSFLRPVVPQVSVHIFRTLHSREGVQLKWSAGQLNPACQYVACLQDYQRFQAYLSGAAYLGGPYDSWSEDGLSDFNNQDSPTAAQGNFSVAAAFVAPYLDCLREFYRPLLDPFDSNLVASSVSDWLMTEELLAVEFNVAGFRDAVVNCLLQATVKDHLESLGDTVKRLLAENDSQRLSLFFRVMVMVDGGLEHLLGVLRRFVRDQMLQTFDGIEAEFLALDPYSAKATSMYIEACVSNMRHCKVIAVEAVEQLHEAARQPSRSQLLGTVRTGIADALNGNRLVEAALRRRNLAGYPATALAHQFHRLMRATRQLDAAATEAIEDLMTLYSLLEDKESFMLRYHTLLRERLLSEGCEHLSPEAEELSVDGFAELSGWKAAYEVKCLLRDFRESDRFNEELRTHSGYQEALQRELGGEEAATMKFTFVRGYFWRIANEEVKLPRPLSTLAAAAAQAYLASRSGRTVSFAYSHGSGLLAFRGGATGEESAAVAQLRCSTAVMILLLCFNPVEHEDDDGKSLDSDVERRLTRAALQALTGIPAEDVKFYLRHLVRTGLIIRSGGEEEDSEEDGDCGFAVNVNFASSGNRPVNLMVSQQQQAQRQRRRLEKLDQRMREKRAQCAIVAEIKAHRRLTRASLFEMSRRRLAASFILHAGFFAEQLAYLESGGYIRFVNENSTPADEAMIEYIP